MSRKGTSRKWQNATEVRIRFINTAGSFLGWLYVMQLYSLSLMLDTQRKHNGVHRNAGLHYLCYTRVTSLLNAEYIIPLIPNPMKDNKFRYEMSLRGYIYRFSEDPLVVGDHYYDFTLHSLGGDPINLCDSESLARIINEDYKKKPFAKRHSAKIIATNDPTLNKAGVPEL